jgi:DNA-binding helix-hairpin-helix protein with protein kinase domain
MQVEVETCTPPELQVRSFEGVVRTANRDDLGLAVMIFLPLFLGRHPFSGRFFGPGDMPIRQAIREGRFAYSPRRAALRMAQPPGLVHFPVVGPQVSSLFEGAVVREAMTAGRPTASEWIEGPKALGFRRDVTAMSRLVNPVGSSLTAAAQAEARAPCQRSGC